MPLPSQAAESYDPHKLETLDAYLQKKSIVGDIYSKATRAQKKSSKGQTSGGTTTTTTTAPNKLFAAKQPHESMRAFNKRIKEETRKVLREDMAKPVMNERRKDYLTEKKKKKKGKGSKGVGVGGLKTDVNGEYYYSDSGDEERKGGDEVEFGEQAEAPPQLKVVPRMRKKKRVAEEEVEEELNANDAWRKKQKVRKEVEMDELRNSVVQQYKLLKQKKRMEQSGGGGRNL